MTNTVSLSFSKDEPEKLESAITVVETFLEELHNSTIKFNNNGENPTINIKRKNQTLICRFTWRRSTKKEFFANACGFSFSTGNIDELWFDFDFPSTGSSGWIVNDNPKIQELIKTMAEYIQKTGRSKLFPTDFLNE